MFWQWHVAGHDHQDFDAILPALTEKYEVLSIDWPGHGKSEWKSGEEISAIYFPLILKEFLKQKAPGGALLVGNSIGGYAAMHVALENPELAKGLVLIDTGGMNEMDFVSKTFIKLKSSTLFTSLVWNLFPKYYTKIKNPHTIQIFERMKKAKENPEAVKTNASLWKSFLDEKYNLRNVVSKIEKPTLIVWGKEDPVIYPKFGVDLKERIANSELALMDTGHLPFAEDPDRFLQILLNYLQRRNL